MTTKINGQLEIDHERGVIYFHSNDIGITILRICNLPKPIPVVVRKIKVDNKVQIPEMLDYRMNNE